MAVGVVAGRFTAPSPAPADAAAVPGNHPRSTRSFVRAEADTRTSGRGASPAARVREEIRRVPPANTPALLEKIMRSADPADRMGLLIEAFEVADGSNVGEVFSAFDRMRHESGQKHQLEYMMAAYVAGKQTGGAVMDSWLEKGFQQNITAAHESFFGWSSQNPQEAEKWLEKIEDQYPAEKFRLMQGLIGGMAVRNPQEAMVRLDSLPEPERSRCVGDLCFHLAQGEGVDSAIDWMLEKKSDTNPENQDYVNAINREVTNRLIWSATGGGGIDETARRLETIHAATPVNPGLLREILRQMPQTGNLDLLDKLSSGAVMSDPATSRQYIQMAVSSSFEKGPSGLLQWVKDHPDSPLRATVEEFTNRRLSANDRRKGGAEETIPEAIPRQNQ